MYTLYYHPYSQHARRVVALLEEAHLEYQLKPVAMEKGEHLSHDFLSINPNHQVPVLIDGDLRLSESNAILRYLSHKHGLSDWYPNDVVERAKVEQWLDWTQCRMASAVIDIVFNKVFLGDKGDLQAIQRGEKRIQELEPILANGLEGHDFIVGNKPTIADLAIASNVTQLGFAQHQFEHPAIQAWYQRVLQIPGFQKSLPQPKA